jgi:hypothetical protein
MKFIRAFYLIEEMGGILSNRLKKAKKYAGCSVQ